MSRHIDTVRPNLPSGSQSTGDTQLEVDPEQEQEDEMGEEAIVPKAVPNVIQPTQREREDHELTHMQFRSWCPHCIAGQGKERNSTATEGPRCIPCFSADYIYIYGGGNNRGDHSNTEL